MISISVCKRFLKYTERCPGRYTQDTLMNRVRRDIKQPEFQQRRVDGIFSKELDVVNSELLFCQQDTIAKVSHSSPAPRTYSQTEWRVVLGTDIRLRSLWRVVYYM